MLDFNTSVGLDVHARSIKAVAIIALTGEVKAATFGYDPAAVAEWALGLPQPARCVYESGVTGFDLQRRLAEAGVECCIGAVSKMVKPAADRRRKNDRNDAEFLARMLLLGQVRAVWVPDAECEADRDLSRALGDARDELQRSRQLLSKFLLRQGYRFDAKYPTGAPVGSWTRRHWEWIKAIEMPEESDRRVLSYYIARVERATEEKRKLESLVKARSESPRWKPTCDALRCMKGVESVTAFAVACEAGDFSRFRSAAAFGAWLGLAPSEHSSGERVVRGGITKAGNKHVRRLLTESAWHYGGCSPNGKDRLPGQECSPGVRAHARKGIARLCAKRREMAERGKPPCAANAATARELACWLWALGMMAQEGAR